MYANSPKFKVACQLSKHLSVLATLRLEPMETF